MDPVPQQFEQIPARLSSPARIAVKSNYGNRERAFVEKNLSTQTDLRLTTPQTGEPPPPGGQSQPFCYKLGERA